MNHFFRLMIALCLYILAAHLFWDAVVEYYEAH